MSLAEIREMHGQPLPPPDSPPPTPPTSEAETVCEPEQEPNPARSEDLRCVATILLGLMQEWWRAHRQAPGDDILQDDVIEIARLLGLSVNTAGTGSNG